MLTLLAQLAPSGADNRLSRTDLHELAPEGFKFSGFKLAELFDSTITGAIFSAAGFIALIYFAFGAFDVLMSEGDPSKLAQGRKRIYYAIVGFLVVFTAYWMTILFTRIFGVKQARDVFI